MSSLGRIQTALGAFSQETTLALANFNLDFALMKIEAPAEYQELGRALSTRRRSVAEQGSTHKTARRLGALFEEDLPSTPHLFRAYGLRASEIAQSSAINPRGGESYGPFSEYIGVDGTTIWAAATSGKGTMAIHLLACMLARIWSASEAVSIWQQILESRKVELSTWDENDTITERNLHTSRIEISQEELAEWDASARAWLRAADIAKRLNQRQLLLIVENLNIPVNKGMEVYESVMLAWKTALSAIDKLVNGSSHSVQNGAVLLGLSAWHLYPDLNIAGAVTTTARQNDPLISPGTIATLGLRGNDPENSSGVYWSLPLAHVRHYGEAVVAERSVNSGQARNSIEDIWQVTLGSLLTLWGQDGMKRKKALELIGLMWQTCETSLANAETYAWRSILRKECWLKLLADASRRYLQSTGNEQASCKGLFGLGQRNFALFGEDLKTEPILGLTDGSLLRILRLEKRIEYLRMIAPSFQNPTDVLVIRTCQRNDKNIVRLHLATTFTTGAADRPTTPNSQSHCPKSWIYKANVSGRPSKKPVLLEVKNQEEFYTLDPDSLESLMHGKWFRWNNPPSDFLDYATIQVKKSSSSDRKPKQWGLFSRNPQHEHLPIQPVATFEYVFGDVESAALFRRRNLKHVSFRKMDREELEFKPGVTMENITCAFTNDMVDPDRFLEYLSGGDVAGFESHPGCTSRCNPLLNPPHAKGESPVNETLRAIATATKIYSGMSNTTVALSVVTRGPIRKAKWFKEDGYDRQSVRSPHESITNNMMLPYNLSRPHTFACIAMFESGNFDLDPENLQSVLAISSGDSIFVAAPILDDPAKRSKPHEIHRIVGNIGRAGIVFLIPPQNPRTKRVGLESYQVINHEPYDGKIGDSFHNTTLHLGFSGYEFALDVGNHGGVYREAFFLESLISVHDRGEWIADLDALNSLGSSKLGISEELAASCGHRTEERDRLPDFDLVTIDRWEELLERPRHAAVVRAHKNWLARLAAAVVSVKMGNNTVVLGDKRCWTCLWQAWEAAAMKDVGDGNSPNTIFIF